jgi:hypothetical protein
MAKDKDKVKAAAKAAKTSTQLHLRVAEVRNDTLVLKNGGVRAVLEADSINFNLKSEPEQQSIIAAYQSFLNTLDFPLQIVVQSKKLDLDNYLADLKKKGEKQENPLLQKQTFEYVEYIERLLEYADIMDKKFYVVVPYESFKSQKVSFFGKVMARLKLRELESDFVRRKKEFDDLKKGLESRVNTIQAGLENCGLKVKRLETKELVELFYRSYNPELSRNQKLEDYTQQDISEV